VIVSPRDTELITDAAEERRRYLNGFISQLDRAYLASMMRYNTVLAERNKFLKMSSDEAMLQIYDMQLAEHGTRVYERRKEIIERMQPMVAEYYSTLSEDREQVEMEYRSELEQMPLTEVLLRNRERDIVNQFTTAGVHRDDIIFRIGGYPLRKYGSQGQQKSFLIALKLAQYRLLAEATGEKPILLLDDLFDKLDLGRVEKLLALVGGDDFGQILITDCNKLRLESTLERADKEYSLFMVEGGDVKR
jgi:DNA replication and repair protein RecF